MRASKWVGVALGAVLLVGCGSSSTADTTAATTAAPAATAAEPTTTETPATTVPANVKRVPQDFSTIQAAVDAAKSGDMILVGEGTYNEQVTVTTDQLVIRGVSRNKVILEGGYKFDNGIRVVGAKGVAIENMTARDYLFNGFYWTGVDGYRGSYLTAVRNGDYGIYAFNSVNGLLEHSYGGGSPDAGFYVGQCNPCNAVLNDLLSEHNGLGYSGTNASGNLIIENSTFRLNRAGIVPNSGHNEKLPPQRSNIIVGNLVYSNNQADTPAISLALLAMGNGILVAGGNDNTIIRNRVWDHDVVGIGAVPNQDDQFWPISGNSVKDNNVSDSRVADLALTADASAKNCFAGNTFTTSKPAKIETATPCSGAPTTPFDADPLPFAALFVKSHPPAGDIKAVANPPDQPEMADPLTAPAVPALNLPPAVNVDSVTLPAKP